MNLPTNQVALDSRGLNDLKRAARESPDKALKATATQFEALEPPLDEPLVLRLDALAAPEVLATQVAGALLTHGPAQGVDNI